MRARGDEGSVACGYLVLDAVDHQDARALNDDDRLLGVVVVGGVGAAGSKLVMPLEISVAPNSLFMWLATVTPSARCSVSTSLALITRGSFMAFLLRFF